MRDQGQPLPVFSNEGYGKRDGLLSAAGPLCVGYTYVEGTKRDKLGDHSERRIPVGYDGKSQAYRMWLPGTENVEIMRNISFVESFPEQVAVLDASGSPTAESSLSATPSVSSRTPVSKPQAVKRMFEESNLSTSRSPVPERQAAVDAREKDLLGRLRKA